MSTFALSVLLVASATGCGSEDITARPNGGSNDPFGTRDKISAHLDGKTLLMESTAVPTHPMGYDEDVNNGQATQCYHTVTMQPTAGRYRVTSKLGTLKNAPNTGDKGECDHDSISAEMSFDSTAVLIANVQGNAECFDFTITYPGFGQEGRGKLSEDGTMLSLELFFKDQAIGHRCADGGVGDQTVTLSQAQFTENAVQIYSVRD